MKSKTTKRALLSSCVALMLCFSMLLGTTYAWFTDSETSVNNVIQSGTLDATLQYKNEAGTYVDASTGKIFDYQYWEPGYVDSKTVKVGNVGSLAFKFQLNIIPNVNDEAAMKLAEVIDVYMFEGEVEIDRDAVSAATPVGTLKTLMTDPDGAAYGVLLPEAGKGTTGTGYTGPEGEIAVTLALKMQESAGNEYQDLSIGGDSGFAVQLLATQLTYEEDSFGNDYDVMAQYSVASAGELNEALEKGGYITLNEDIVLDGTASLEIAADVKLVVNLNGHSITNAVVGAPALINNGDLTILGDGAIVNGTNTANKSHTIRNYGTLTIEGGNIGTDDTAGAAIVNDGTAVINGGTFASKQENVKADGLCAYVFINNGTGTMTINDATFNGQTHGLFGAYNGEIIVNGGNYTMDGNGGLGCYAVYATGDAVVTLNGGTIKTDNPRSNRYFFVYNNGNYFNKDAVETGKVIVNGASIYLNGNPVYVDGAVHVSTVAEANSLLAKGGNTGVTLSACNEPTAVLAVPANYTGTLTLNNVTLKSVNAAGDADIVIVGDVVVNATGDGIATVSDENSGVSAITAVGELNISGSGKLTAIGYGKHGYGIGGESTTAITVENIAVDYVAGGYAYGVGTDTKYYKDAPEGGAAIGSGCDGAVITLKNVTVTKAIGGSKAAGIGARYHIGVTVNIEASTITYVEGGVSAAGIGGSRVSNGAAESGTTINISDSNITAQGGAYGAGIGSGYDTYCQSSQPLCAINIIDSTINATGGKYAAGVGTGYHNAALAGEIKNSTVTAASGEKYYKDTYTLAMDVGFGVTDPNREGSQINSYITYNGEMITLTDAPYPVSSEVEEN